MAPAENAGASLPITSASKFRDASSTPAVIIATVSPPMAFIFEWNSRPSTPSPRSTRLAPAFRRTDGRRSFARCRICRSGARGGIGPSRKRMLLAAGGAECCTARTIAGVSVRPAASSTLSTPMASQSSKGPSSQPKPHRMARSTSSMVCAIWGATSAAYTSVGASVARRNSPTRSRPWNRVRIRSPWSSTAAAASSAGSRGDRRAR